MRVVEFLRRARLTALSGPGGSAYLVFLVWDQVEARYLLTWWVALFLVDMESVRYSSKWLRRLAPATSDLDDPAPTGEIAETGIDVNRVAGRQIAGQILAGLVWGSSALWVVADPQNYEVLLLTWIVLMASACICAIGLLHFRSAFVGYMAAVWSIPLVVMLLAGGGRGVKLAVGVVVLLISLNFYLWEASAQLNNGLARRVRADSRRQAVEVKASEIQRMAAYDEITGCMTRRAGMGRVRTMSTTAAANPDLKLSLILADLDMFKSINDTYGHAAGDQVLREVGERLRAAVRDGDVAIRYGGEEFLIAAYADEQAARALADRVRAAVVAEPVEIPDRALTCTLSAGVGTLTAGESIEAALIRIDKALYRAKDAGRNRTVSALTT